MEQLFITDININKLRHLEKIQINISQIERKHLILTGKNGSGKTSVLVTLNEYFISLFLNSRHLIRAFYNELPKLNKNTSAVREEEIRQIYLCYPTFNSDFPVVLNLLEGGNSEFIYTYFEAKRTSKITQPAGINKINLSNKQDVKLNDVFLQYIVNLKAEKSFANDDKDFATVEKIDKWFVNFEDKLRKIFNDDSLELVFDRKNYTFYFKSQEREQLGFNELSDGYSAVIDILTELILKVEASESKSFDIQGVVLIDEVETHLHLELQQNILPLLTSFFPNIQFIVTTHSPVVLASLENCVIYDLENGIRTEDYSDLSYGSVAKYYFNISHKESEKLKTALTDFKQLIENKTTISEEEQDKLLELDAKFRRLGPLFAPEVFNQYLNLRNELNK